MPALGPRRLNWIRSPRAVIILPALARLSTRGVAMLEIEQRYAKVDEADLRARLAGAGARPVGEHAEADHYFNAPDRDFVQTGEAFRLRRTGASNVLTYKGPRLTGGVKVRPEIEVPLADGD